MDIQALERILQEMTSDAADPRGFPFFVNATSGTTVLGSFDDLEAISRLCERYKCWMHMDGSWGGPVVFSDTWRPVLLRGCSSADSVTINPHKLLNVPQQCSFLLVRDARVLQNYNVQAGYLFHKDSTERRNDPAMKTLGCGRRGDALKLYIAWQRYGRVGFGRHVDHGIELAQRVLAKICDEPRLELGPLADPLFLQICFRPNVDGDKSRATHFAIKQLNTRRHYAVDYAPLQREVGDYVRCVTGARHSDTRLVIHPRIPWDVFSAIVDEVAAISNAWAASQ